MTESDLPLVFKWRNHESIRNQSEDTDPINWLEHINWFRQSHERFIFTRDGVPQGVTSLSLNDFWSFYLNPELPKDRGFGTVMLALFLNYLKGRKHSVQARVLQTNLPSIKLHTKLGFETIRVKDGIHEFRLKIR